jgi:hypothetical protein
LAYLFDARCGVPPVNRVDEQNGEEVVCACAQTEAWSWGVLLLLVAAAIVAASLASHAPGVAWASVLPVGAALLLLAWPFFAVRDFRAAASSFATSGMNKSEWVAVSNANEAARTTAGATLGAGLLVLFGLTAVGTAAVTQGGKLA